MTIKSFSQIKKNKKLAFTNLSEVRIALLGDSVTRFLCQAIHGLGLEQGLDLVLWEADFNQIDRQVFDPLSELYEFKPEIVIVFLSTHKQLDKYNKLRKDQRAEFANKEIEHIDQIYKTIQGKIKANLVLYNFPEINDSVFGNFSNKLETSFLFQLRTLNFKLMTLASHASNLHLCDLSTVQNEIGKGVMFHPSIYVNAEMVLSIDAIPIVASRTLDIVAGMKGRFKKCLILDLDNTLWGGVIGDDGIENIQLGSLGIGKAFTEFQYWIKKLKERGIILAVCSKNMEHIAKEPFEKHPDMVLRLEDISVFVANWKNKVENITLIQQTLNISFDSMVFLDDNPSERSFVRENIQGITVPELPDDPAEYLEHLYSLNLFETLSYSNEDEMRTVLYQLENQRMRLQEQHADEASFLQKLNMTSVVETFTSFNIPRVAQLSQRSNQFNLRTIRYTEKDIAEISVSPTHLGLTFTLEDKFGGHGLICAVILKKVGINTLFIDSWFMSCRVLKRSMENFVLNTLVEFALGIKCTCLTGEYVPTGKNELVKNHYKDLGFLYLDECWELNLNEYQSKQSFISKKLD